MNGSVAGCGLESKVDGKTKKTTISLEQDQVVACYYLGGKDTQHIEAFSPSALMENTQEENREWLSKVPIAIVFKIYPSSQSLDALQKDFEERAEKLKGMIQNNQTEITGIHE